MEQSTQVSTTDGVIICCPFCHATVPEWQYRRYGPPLGQDGDYLWVFQCRSCRQVFAPRMRPAS